MVVRIAIVDHEPAFLRVMETLLKSDGYEVLPIQDGADSYSLVKEGKPDLVLIDTWLSRPDDGVDVIQAIRLDPDMASIPIVVTSSDDKRTTEAKLLRPDFPNLKLLFKPFDPDHLLLAVREMLGRHPS